MGWYVHTQEAPKEMPPIYQQIKPNIFTECNKSIE